MKFVLRRKVVEAERFDLGLNDNDTVWNGFEVYHDEDLFLPYVLVNTPDGVKRVENGDWVVTHKNGVMSVMQPDKFEREYEKLKEP